ncbi:heme-binding protein [Guyparkeria hydrothermalis]|uniref:GlcG/HbpS family heme-binding protein n=1 Tax=Guyparkeria hydrothermalis TaxID=923 RepID=UPI00202007DB|nr:heme-binding protein [Guyparkeria hydrothermalis]MCL7744557.1 heme-binding protein [Guyparkeria hydrothermalis]
MYPLALMLVCLLTASVGRAESNADGAGDVVTAERIGMGLAADIAEEAVAACAGQGYAVTAVVVDPSGDPQVMMRATHAPRFTRQIAADKARAVILSGIDSGAFRANRGDIRQEMNHVDGVLMLDGAVLIESAGSTIGALGVSGAPGGDKDAACARQALDAFFERLQLR